MGTITFNTDVDKTVDINKTVNVNVNKDVFTSVDLSGNLATAEASADAIGGGGGGGGEECISLDFTLDSFDEPQETTVSSGGSNPQTESTTVGPGFAGTDILNAIREAEVTRFDGLGGAETSIDIATAGQANFSNDQDVNSDQILTYTSTDDSYSILVDCEPPGVIDFTDPVANQIVLDNVEFIGENGTLRFEIMAVDAQGDMATVAAYAASLQFAIDNGVNAFDDGQDIIVPLGLLTNDLPQIPDDTELNLFGPGSNVGFYSAGANFNFGGDGTLDLDQLVSLDFKLLGDTGSYGTPQTALEDPTTDAWDVSIEGIRVLSECCVEVPGDGNLAETETFAQVTEDGAFSFSDSLAASDFFVT